MARRDIQFERWPIFEKLWRKAANKRWDISKIKNAARQHKVFESGDDWFDWWKSNKPMPDKNDCQMGLF